MSHKIHYPGEIKSLEQSGYFTGYASVFEYRDAHDDIIVSGAFKDIKPNKVKLLWQHQADQPIGIITKIYEDDIGLYIEGKLLLSVKKAREAYDLLQQGIINSLSIGFTPKKFRYSQDGQTRIIEDIDLWEVSLVTFPANNAAQITSVKDAGAGLVWALKQASQILNI